MHLSRSSKPTQGKPQVSQAVTQKNTAKQTTTKMNAQVKLAIPGFMSAQFSVERQTQSQLKSQEVKQTQEVQQISETQQLFFQETGAFVALPRAQSRDPFSLPSSDAQAFFQETGAVATNDQAKEECVPPAYDANDHVDWPSLKE